VPQVAAPQPKINGTNDLNQLYGRYEVRFRADEVNGYKTAWLLWPKSEKWPRDGEIDFVEGNLNSTIGAFMHRQGGTSGGDQDSFKPTARYNNWHTAALEWMPNRLQVFLDGVAMKTTTGADRVTSRIPNTPMRCVLQTETELNKTYPAQAAVANVQIELQGLALQGGSMSDTSNEHETAEGFQNPYDLRSGDDEAFADYVKAHGGNPPGDPNDNGPDEYDD
jgi:beta-glucanase (GH16 family)